MPSKMPETHWLPEQFCNSAKLKLTWAPTFQGNLPKIMCQKIKGENVDELMGHTIITLLVAKFLQNIHNIYNILPFTKWEGF